MMYQYPWDDQNHDVMQDIIDYRRLWKSEYRMTATTSYIVLLIASDGENSDQRHTGWYLDEPSVHVVCNLLGPPDMSAIVPSDTVDDRLAIQSRIIFVDHKGSISD